MISLKVCRAPFPVSGAPGRSGAGTGHPLPRAAPTLIYSHLFLAAQGCLPRFDGDSPVCAAPCPGARGDLSPARLPLNFSPAAPGTPATGRARGRRDAAASRAFHREFAGRGGGKKAARRCQGTAHAGDRAHGAFAGAVGVFLGGPTEGSLSRPRVTERHSACLTITILHCPSSIHEGNIF